MRPTSPGTILDASALIALPRSIYGRTLVDLSVREHRPLVIPVAALYSAVLGGADPADFDVNEFTVTPITQAIVPGLAMIARTPASPIPLDIAHVAWEAQVTGYPVLTDNPGPYAYLGVGIDLEVL